MMKEREEFLKKLNEGIASIEKADRQMMEEVTKFSSMPVPPDF